MPSFTRKAIMDSCMRLLEERPLSKITVKDIVEDCGVNRNTFYYHFQDLPTLIEEIAEEQADQILKSNSSAQSLEECLRTISDFILKNRRVMQHIYNSGNRDVFERCLFQVCEHVVSGYVDLVCRDQPVRADDKELIIHSYKCECFGQIIAWMNGGMQESALNGFIRLCELRKGATEAMIRRSIEG